MRRHLRREKGDIIDKSWLESTGEEKGMRNDELEAPLESSWESPDKNIDGKEWRNFPSIKWILEEEILVLEEKQKGGRMGKTKATWRRMKQHRWEEVINDLANVDVNGSTWRETRRLKRIDMTISIVEKDWYSHRSMRTPFRKGMESTLDIEATRIPQLKTKTKDWLAK